MNRRHYTIMTIDDHRAAAREWATARRSVTEFENAICDLLRQGRRAGPSAKAQSGRIPGTVKRIHRFLEKVQIGMREHLLRTLPGEWPSADCWREAPATESAAVVQQGAVGAFSVEPHIRAARALAPAQPAIHGFLDIIRLRRHLTVRIMDDAIRALHLIQYLRCQMEDLQFYSLSGRGIPWVNCWLGPNNHVDRGEEGIPNPRPARYATAGAN